MRSFAIATLMVLGAFSVAPGSASAASINVIGQFSWDPGDPLFGPTFTFEYFSGDLLTGLSLDLETTDGSASYLFDTSVGFDSDGDGFDDRFRSQVTNDLSGLTILMALVRATDSLLLLLDPDASVQTPLVDSTGAPRGLDGVTLVSAFVGLEVQAPPPPEPVPEPATLMLLGAGIAGTLIRSRLHHRR